MCSALATCDETVSISPNRASRPGSDLQTVAPLFARLYIDGFFASVERSLRPKFRTRPVFVVTSSKSGSADAPTILSTSYEAKLLGVSVGMSLEDALAVCPQAAVVPCRFSLYAEYAESVRAILDGFSSAVQPDSTDGFYIDLSGVADTRSLDGDFSGTLRRLQLEILKRTGLSASIGAAKTRVAAAVASRLERPRGLRIVAAGTEAAWLATLPVEALHGINQIDANNLRKRGVRSIAELRRVPLASLEGIYGQSTGRQIWENSRSLDQTVPKSKPAAPSLTREFTFDPGVCQCRGRHFSCGLRISLHPVELCSGLRSQRGSHRFSPHSLRRPILRVPVPAPLGLSLAPIRRSRISGHPLPEFAAVSPHPADSRAVHRRFGGDDFCR